MEYAKVAINLPAKNIFRQFTYHVPEALDFLTQGWRVVVPFGQQLLEGFIVEEDRDPDRTRELKDIADVVGTEPWFDREMLATAYWLSQYYLCTLAEALRLFIPGKRSLAAVGKYVTVPGVAGLSASEQELYDFLTLKGPLSRKAIRQLPGGESALKGLITRQAVVLSYDVKYKLREKSERTFAATPEGLAAERNGEVRGKSQKAALDLLCSGKVYSAGELERQGISAESLRNLVRKGWLLEGRRRVLRDSYEGMEVPRETLELTGEQQAAIQTVEEAREKQEARTFLLQGITGSGKTEVYLRLTARALQAGRQVMVLVPEIALTGQIVKRFKAWFGGAVAVAHSRLSPGERADVWCRMRSDRKSVV